jgi:hypothetical protein
MATKDSDFSCKIYFIPPYKESQPDQVLAEGKGSMKCIVEEETIAYDYMHKLRLKQACTFLLTTSVHIHQLFLFYFFPVIIFSAAYNWYLRLHVPS